MIITHSAYFDKSMKPTAQRATLHVDIEKVIWLAVCNANVIGFRAGAYHTNIGETKLHIITGTYHHKWKKQLYRELSSDEVLFDLCKM